MAYNPGITWDTTRMGESIRQAGRDLAEFIDDMSESRKRRNRNAQLAESMFKINPDMLEEIGMEKEEFAALSADDKIAHMEALVQSRGFRGQEIGLRMQEAQVEEMGERIKNIKGNTAFDKSERRRETRLRDQTAKFLEYMGKTSEKGKLGNVGAAMAKFPDADPQIQMQSLKLAAEQGQDPLEKYKAETARMNAEANRAYAELKKDLAKKAGVDIELRPLSKTKWGPAFQEAGIDVQHLALFRDEDGKSRVINVETKKSMGFLDEWMAGMAGLNAGEGAAPPARATRKWVPGEGLRD